MSARLLAAVTALVVSVAAHPRPAASAEVSFAGAGRQAVATLLQVYYAGGMWRACNALGEFSATRDLQPDDPRQWIRDRLRGETRDIAIAGHFPHLPRLLALLVTGGEAGTDFPAHGAVALTTDDGGETWKELWRVES